MKIAGSGSPRLSDVQHPRLRKRSSMASALAASMLSGLKSGIKAYPKAGGGSGVFSRSRNLMLRSIRILGTFASVKSSFLSTQTSRAFPAIPSDPGHRNPTFQFRRRPSSSHYVELNIMRFMISKKLCGVKISLCRERGFILHIIFIMIPTNLRYFCLATFSFLESPGIPEKRKWPSKNIVDWLESL